MYYRGIYPPLIHHFIETRCALPPTTTPPAIINSDEGSETTDMDFSFRDRPSVVLIACVHLDVVGSTVIHDVVGIGVVKESVRVCLAHTR